jgi:peptidyl-prolyl cis-trans isomerase SurA
MFDVSVIVTACRRSVAVAAVACIALIFANASASAQQVIMMVNGDPITNFDVEQRTRLLQLMGTGKVPARQEVLDDLIDEKIKLGLPRRFDFSSVNLDTEAENAIGRMAQKARKTKQQFAQELEKSGVQIGTLKSRLKAEIVWTQVIRGKFQSSFQINESEILTEMQSRGKDDKGGFDYTLRPIVFIVRPGSPDSAFEARRREAEGLRVRFDGCDEGIKFARALRDVVVRDQVTRSSADLPPQLREILEKSDVGKLSPPERTQQGIELYAMCGKKQSNADNTPAKREVREELYSAQFKAKSEKYLKELRSQAYIVPK